MKKLKLGESKFGLTKACSQGFDATDGKDAGYRVSQDDEQCFQADVMDIKLNVCVYIYIYMEKCNLQLPNYCIWGLR